MKRLLAVVLFVLFAFPVFAQDDTMPAYVLVKAVDGWTQDDPMVYQTGYIVQVMPTNQYGGKQILPKFCQFVITDGTVEQIRSYAEEWRREIDWEVVSSTLATDTHTLRVFTKAELVSASGLNGLTRDKVEEFLNKWKGTVNGISANSVNFTVKVSDAIASEGFWNMDVINIGFAEKAYVSSTGLHTTEVDYSVVGATQEQIAAIIVNNGCEVISTKPAQRKLSFTCSRANVFSQFKQDVLGKVDSSFARRKWYINQSAIDAAIAAGGSLELTRQQALNALHNRLLD